SGLNFHRPGFTSLVRDICKDKISQVVVTYRDRLCRFGYELFEQVCKLHNTSILVYGERDDKQHDSNAEPGSELKDDLLAVASIIVASYHGRRGAKLKKERKRLAECSAKSETLPDNIAETKVETNV